MMHGHLKFDLSKISLEQLLSIQSSYKKVTNRDIDYEFNKHFGRIVLNGKDEFNRFFALVKL